MPCETVTVDEPTTDESKLEISGYNLSSTNPNEVTASFTVDNVIISGNGQTLDGIVSVTIDGSEKDSFSVTLDPDQSQSETRKYTGVASGSRQVCVTVN
jgi:hypothetical protein